MPGRPCLLSVSVRTLIDKRLALWHCQWGSDVRQHATKTQLPQRRQKGEFTFSRRTYPEQFTVSTGTFHPTSFGRAGNRPGNFLITSPTPSPLSHLTPWVLLIVARLQYTEIIRRLSWSVKQKNVPQVMHMQIHTHTCTHKHAHTQTHTHTHTRTHTQANTSLTLVWTR